MDYRTEHRGACLCGAVGVIAKPKTDKVVVCHIGLLEDSDAWTLSEQIFIDRKPAFYSFAENTKNLTEDEVLSP